jgi:hypothetical protein
MMQQENNQLHHPESVIILQPSCTVVIPLIVYRPKRQINNPQRLLLLRHIFVQEEW